VSILITAFTAESLASYARVTRASHDGLSFDSWWREYPVSFGTISRAAEQESESRTLATFTIYKQPKEFKRLPHTLKFMGEKARRKTVSASERNGEISPILFSLLHQHSHFSHHPTLQRPRHCSPTFISSTCECCPSPLHSLTRLALPLLQYLRVQWSHEQVPRCRQLSGPTSAGSIPPTWYQSHFPSWSENFHTAEICLQSLHRRRDHAETHSRRDAARRDTGVDFQDLGYFSMGRCRSWCCENFDALYIASNGRPGRVDGCRATRGWEHWGYVLCDGEPHWWGGWGCGEWCRGWKYYIAEWDGGSESRNRRTYCNHWPFVNLGQQLGEWMLCQEG